MHRILNGLPPSCPRVGDPGSREYQLSMGDGISRFSRLQKTLTLSFSLDPEQRLGRCQNTTEPQPCYAQGKAGPVVDLDSQP